MHLLFFYQYYHNPDCAATGRHYTFVKHLAKKHRVTVVTTDTWYKKRITCEFDWVPEGAVVHMLDVPYANEMSAAQRMASYGRYALKSLVKGLRVARPDLVIGVSTPLTAAWTAAKISHLLRIPWVFEVQDLWPDFPVQMGALQNPWIQKRLYVLEQHLYQRAAHVVTLSPDMEAHVLRHGISEERVTTLLNGTDLDFAAHCTEKEVAALRREHHLDDAKVILYAGTFGRANDIPCLIEAAQRLAHRSDLRFVFLGEGYFAPELHEAARRHPNMLVLPPVPRHRIFSWFKLASLSLVSFRDLPVLAANSPAKLFDSLAVGTPVIVTNPGWTKTFVEEHGCGWHVPASDPPGLVRGIEGALAREYRLCEAGRRGRAIAQQAFDRERLAQKLEEIVEQVARGART